MYKNRKHFFCVNGDTITEKTMLNNHFKKYRCTK